MEFLKIEAKQKFSRTLDDGKVSYFLLPDDEVIIHATKKDGETVMNEKFKVYARLYAVDGIGSLINRINGTYLADFLPLGATKNINPIEDDLPTRFTDDGMILEGTLYRSEKIIDTDRYLLEL
jgi:hypothetical protein